MTASGSVPPRRVVVGVTGASGSLIALRLLAHLGALGVERHLVISPAGRRTARYEIGAGRLEGEADACHPWRDVGSALASGSFPVDAVAIVPCSVHSLSAIAYGITDSLITRVADVALKERRPLVLCFREAPLHLGHLRAMTQVTEAGAIVCPPMPAFYLRPATIDEMVDLLAIRLAALLGFPVPGAPVWEGDVGAIVDDHRPVGD